MFEFYTENSAKILINIGFFFKQTIISTKLYTYLNSLLESFTINITELNICIVFIMTENNNYDSKLPTCMYLLIIINWNLLCN